MKWNEKHKTKQNKTKQQAMDSDVRHWNFKNNIFFLFLERNRRVVWEGTSFNTTESKGNI